MNPAGPLSEELVDFISVLRQNGFTVSTEQCLAAMRLLVSFAAQGDLLEQPERLGGMLGPIFCTSREEQEAFPYFYRQWANHLPSRPAAPEASATGAPPLLAKPPAQQPSERVRPRRSFRRHLVDWLTSLPLLLGAGTIVVAIVIALFPAQDTVTGVVKDSRGTSLAGVKAVVRSGFNQTVVGETVSGGDGGFSLAYDYYRLVPSPSLYVSVPGYQDFSIKLPTTGGVLQITLLPGQSAPNATAQTFDTTFYLVVGMSILIWVMWALHRRYRRVMALEKLRTKHRPRLNSLAMQEAADQLACLFPLRRTAQALRRYRYYSAYDLDVQRTIEATFRKGLFTPSYVQRKSVPEYLVLIDRASFGDQQARLTDEIRRRLDRHDVFIERYYFQGDPRLCRKDNPKIPHQTLQELASRYPEHYLLIFSDAEGFFNPLTGHPHRWLDQFSAWETRILLSSEFQSGSYGEWVLSAAGFKILSTSQTGLAALGDAVHPRPGRERDLCEGVQGLPALLRGKTDRWLEDVPPEPEMLEELCRQLEVFLSPEGYYWLSACAVYPLLNWNLTLHLGRRLLSPSHFTKSFSMLMRLPWFRRGSMPDWLRTRLIKGMSPTQEESVRDELRELLLTPQQGGSVLHVAVKPEGLLQKVWRRLSGGKWDENGLLLKALRAEPEGSVLRDYVLLDFMAGRRVNKLALIVPAEIRKLLSIGNGSGAGTLAGGAKAADNLARGDFTSLAAQPEPAGALTLDALSPGMSAKILYVSGQGRLARRLIEMGFVPGAPVSVVRYAPLGDPIEYCLYNSHIALRRSEARTILVEAVS